MNTFVILIRTHHIPNDIILNDIGLVVKKKTSILLESEVKLVKLPNFESFFFNSEKVP